MQGLFYILHESQGRIGLEKKLGAIIFVRCADTSISGCVNIFRYSL